MEEVEPQLLFIIHLHQIYVITMQFEIYHFEGCLQEV